MPKSKPPKSPESKAPGRGAASAPAPGPASSPGTRPGLAPIPSIKVVLMPTDFSENAYRALPWVVMSARAHGAEIHLLHVLPDHGVENPQYSYWVGGSFQTARFLEDAWTRIRAEKSRFGEGFEPKRVEVRLGDPATQIDEYARDVGAGLIVMSTHDLAWWERLLVGSITEQVLRDAPCPVLVIPSEESLQRTDPKTGITPPKP